MTQWNVTDNSAQVMAAFDRQVKRGAEAIGETAVGYAKQETPVKWGRLRNSEDYKVISGDGIYIGTNVEYAPYVEYNEDAHHKVGNAHFLKNAAANHSDQYKNIMQTSLQA